MKKLLPIIFLIVSCNNPSDVKTTIEYVNSPEHIAKDYPFSEATIVNGVIYVSGQIGTLADGSVIEGGIEPETIQSLNNIEAVLKRLGGSKDDIFKCTCMLKDIKDWPAMSKAYKSYFDTQNLPSRSAFAGSGLALGALVEIECLALKN